MPARQLEAGWSAGRGRETRFEAHDLVLQNETTRHRAARGSPEGVGFASATKIYRRSFLLPLWHPTRKTSFNSAWLQETKSESNKSSHRRRWIWRRKVRKNSSRAA